MTMSDPMYTQSGFPFCATGWWSCSVSSCVIVDSLQKQSPGGEASDTQQTECQFAAGG